MAQRPLDPLAHGTLIEPGFERDALQDAFNLFIEKPTAQAFTALRKTMELYEHAMVSVDHDRYAVLSREAALALDIVIKARKTTDAARRSEPR